jgi:hypothetical protein
MHHDHIVTWEAHEPGAGDKESGWYWVVGIIAAGIAVASGIAGDYLFSVIAVIGGFAIMLAGSRPGVQRTYALSDRGIHIGHERIPFSNIKSFAIHDEDPRRLVIGTASLMGTLSIPLGDADFRAVRTELKNRNIEEDDELDSVAERFAKVIGI